MAEGDPPVPATQTAEQIAKSTAAFDNNKLVIEGVSGALHAMGNKAADVVRTISDLAGTMIAAGDATANTTALTKEQANAFTFISSQIIGASEAYSKLNAINTNLVGNQLNELWAKASKGISTFGGVSDAAFSMAKAFGMPVEKIKEFVGGAGGSVTKLKDIMTNQIATFSKSVDNVARLRDTYIQMQGAAGGLTGVWARSGGSLQNLNGIVDEQQRKINGIVGVTGIAKEKVIEYYQSLGKIPGALSEQIAKTGETKGVMDGLVARTRIAAATGREFKDVQADTTKALHAYNITGADALTYVSRMTELNGKFGMELSDTQGFMNDTAESFKYIGNEAEGSAKVFNKLMTAFKETGLSANASKELIAGFTKQIGNLSIAQKSFLSSQTGGSGGLVGGFQIEKMLRDGKIDEVFDKVQKQMTRQFGKIVSIDEAAKSPQAASQLVRQRAMLQGGPLGSFAKDDASAQRILDAFKKGQKIDVKELSKGDELVNKNLDIGKAWQDKTLTVMHSGNTLLESIRDSGAIVANRLMEDTFTGAAKGEAGKNIRSTINAGRRDNEEKINSVVNGEKSTPRDTSVITASKDLKQAGRLVHTVPHVATSALQGAKSMIPSAPLPTAATTKKREEGKYQDLVNKSKPGQTQSVDDFRNMVNEVKNRFGKIYSSSDAQNSPDAAAKFQHQREMLKNTGTVKTDAEATKLLDKLQVSFKNNTFQKDSSALKEEYQKDFTTNKENSKEEPKENYMSLFKTNQKSGPEQMQAAKSVGPVRTVADDKANASRTDNQARANQTNRNSEPVKFDPLTIKVVVDNNGNATVTHTERLNIMNLPKGGSST